MCVKRLFVQGGFVGQSCSVYTQTASAGAADGWVDTGAVVCPDDTNALQQFPVRATACALRILFAASTDTFGRVTVYKLDVIGQEEGSQP